MLVFAAATLPSDPTAPAAPRAEAAGPEPGAKKSRLPSFKMATTALACLVLGMGVLNLPQAGSTHVVSDAGELMQACGGTAQGLEPCILGKLTAVLDAKGAEPAFQILENATAQDPSLDGQAHHLAHALGRATLSAYPSAPEALRHCPLTLASGCFHGVLERHFGNAGPPRQASDLTLLCGPQDGRNRQFQCLHGLGHGLDMAAMHNLPQALAWCELLPDPWSQDSCGGGAFMENAVGDTSMDATGAGMGHHHAGMAMDTTWVRVKPDDLQYPCDAVAQKWWHACYWLQSSVVLGMGKAMDEAFRACDDAPHTIEAAAPFGYDGVCYESMGREAANPGRTHNDHGQIIQLCMEGQFNLRGRCIYGAVQTLMNNDGRSDPGFEFCKAAPLRQKVDCYMGLGVMVNALGNPYAGKLKDCQRSEPKYVLVCLKGASAA
jgi:hypothetical protein